MKCPKCDGTGKAEIGVGAFTIHGADCDQCNGKGIVEPMTNEEYLKSCNTEQLAEEIYYLTWFHTELDERLDKNVKNGCYNDDENIKIVMEWLKQPHQKE